MKKKVKKQGEGGEAAQRKDEAEGAPKAPAAWTKGSTRNFGGPVTGRDAPRDVATTRHIMIPVDLDLFFLLGTADQVLRSLERGFLRVSFYVIGRDITISDLVSGAGVTVELVEELIALARTGHPLEAPAVNRAISLLGQMGLRVSPKEEILSVWGHSICSKSEEQRVYIEAIDRSTIVFGIGLARTGKTYLAAAQTIQRLLSGEVKRIVLTHPVVEADGNLGFLSGSLINKIDPYLQSPYDVLQGIPNPETLPKLMAAGTVEITPLVCMRERTLNDSFTILDKAQNTTANQMRMFLTRVDFSLQIVVTGDTFQIDLPGSGRSSLVAIEKILHGIEGVEFCRFTSADVIRHESVGGTTDTYGHWEDRTEGRRTLTSRSRTFHRTDRHQGGQG